MFCFTNVLLLKLYAPETISTKFNILTFSDIYVGWFVGLQIHKGFKRAPKKIRDCLHSLRVLVLILHSLRVLVLIRQVFESDRASFNLYIFISQLYLACFLFISTLYIYSIKVLALSWWCLYLYTLQLK